MNIHITGTGSYIPEVIKKNSDFSNHSFFNIEGDSDALIVKGLIAILLSLYRGKTLLEAQAVDPRAEFEKLGLNAHLSSQRSNGLKSMIDQIKIFVNT